MTFSETKLSNPKHFLRAPGSLNEEGQTDFHVYGIALFQTIPSRLAIRLGEFPIKTLRSWF